MGKRGREAKSEGGIRKEEIFASFRFREVDNFCFCFL